MSHTTTYKHKITDIGIFIQTCIKNHIEHQYKNGEVFPVRLYDREYLATASAMLEKWKFPIIIKEGGSILYDNFGGSWGSMDELGKLLQQYNQEVISQSIDYSDFENVTQTVMEDGSIKIELIEEY